MPNCPDQYRCKRLKTFNPISSDTFSRPPHSTTLPLLRGNDINRLDVYEGFLSAHLLPKILREPLHRLATRGVQRFDVVLLGDSYGTVSQNRLNRPVLNSK